MRKTLKQFIKEQEVNPEHVAAALEQAQKDLESAKTPEEEKFHRTKIEALKEIGLGKKLN